MRNFFNYQCVFIGFSLVLISSFSEAYPIYVDKNNIAWSVRSNILIKQDQENKIIQTFQLESARDTIKYIVSDALNRIWLASESGITCFQMDTLRQLGFEDGLLKKKIACLLTDQSGVTWIGTNGGLFYFDPNESLKIKRWKALAPIPVQFILESEKAIWIRLPDGSLKYITTLAPKTDYMIYTLGLSVVVIGLSAFLFFNRFRKQNRLEAEKLALEYQMLLQQMNPHFLFNSLNAIREHLLNSNKPEVSAQYLQNFSVLVRLYLECSRRKSITIATEITCLENYLSLEQFRTEHKFEYKITIHPVGFDQVELPPFFIQPIVENAIWHGLLPKDVYGVLQIHFEVGREFTEVTITDNGVGRNNAAVKPGKSTSGYALKIIRERISIENKLSGTGKDIEFRITDLFDQDQNTKGTEAYLKFPIYLS